MLGLSEAVVLLPALGVHEMFNLSHKEFTNSKQARFGAISFRKDFPVEADANGGGGVASLLKSRNFWKLEN